MTTSQSRTLRKAGAVALSLALAMSTLAITPASAAKKVKLAKTKITVNVGKTKKVKIKNVNKKQVKKLTVKSSKKAVATAKKAGKVAIKVTGKKKGSAKVTANLKLKTKVAGKKAYKLTLKVTVKKAATPVEPTVAPTAAPTPVVSGASITLDKPAGYTCSVNGADVTITANILPATSNENVDWSVADPTIASVSGAGATVNGVATATLKGLKEGKTTVTAKIAAMSASAIVTVEKEKIYAKITDVKQTKANEIVVSFDKDARKDNQGFDKGKFDIDVKNNAGQVTKTIPVNKLVTDTVSGTSATLTLDSAFADGDKVTANLYKGTDMASSFDFVASVGAPASVGITKTQYQKGVEEKVEFAVYDAKGIDVTKAQTNIDAVVRLSVSSDLDGTSNLSQASSATLTMNTVGKTATLTIEYTATNNTTGKPDFTNSALITCIEPIPVIGTAHFQKTENVKVWSDDTTGTAGFYKGKDIENVTVDAEGTFKLSFYASDEDGNAISYDAYEVKSSNGDKMSAVVVTGETGKYTNIEIAGVSAGTATLNLTATKNTKPANYTISVTVKAAASKIGNITLTASRSKVSNAFDTVYTGGNTVEAKITDANGNDITNAATYAWEVTKPTSDKLEARSISVDNKAYKAYVGGAECKFRLISATTGTKKVTFSAMGAKSGSYTLTLTVDWKGDTKTATQVISVVNVPDSAYIGGNSTGCTMTYSVEGDATLEIKGETVDTNGDGTADGYKGVVGTARLKAETGGVFAGYVNGEGEDAIGVFDDNITWTHTADNGAISNHDDGLTYPRATAATEITQAPHMNVRAGAKWVSGTVEPGVNLFNRDATFKSNSFEYGNGTTGDITGAITYTAFAYRALTAAAPIYYSDEKDDVNVAKKGTYTVQFKYAVGYKKDNVTPNDATTTKDLTVTVKNSLYIPKVSVENRTLDSLDNSSIKDAMKTDVDLNCNTSNNASIIDVYGQFDATADGNHKSLDFSKSSVSISYVSVSEGGFVIYLPTTAAFNAAS